MRRIVYIIMCGAALAGCRTHKTVSESTATRDSVRVTHAERATVTSTAWQADLDSVTITYTDIGRPTVSARRAKVRATAERLETEHRGDSTRVAVKIRQQEKEKRTGQTSLTCLACLACLTFVVVIIFIKKLKKWGI